jgi:hypothetical protein
MKTEQMVKVIKDIVSQREHMYEKKLAFRTLVHLAAIGKIKKQISIVNYKKPEGVKKIILFLEPELRLILPGKESIFYESTVEKLNNLIKECKQ